MKKHAAAICLSLVSVAAMAQGAHKPLDVLVELTLDKQPVVHMSPVSLKDDFGAVKPFAFSTGETVGEVTCTTSTSNGVSTSSLTAHQKFVGMSLAFQPVSEHDGKIFGHVTVQNDTAGGYRDVKGADGCTSRYVETTGLAPTSFDVAISTEAETIVPIKDQSGTTLSAAHYTLRIKPEQD